MQTIGTLVVLAGLVVGVICYGITESELDPSYDWVSTATGWLAAVLVIAVVGGRRRNTSLLPQQSFPIQE